MLMAQKMESQKNLLKKRASLIRKLILVLGSISGIVAIALHLIIAHAILSSENNPLFLTQLLSLIASAASSLAVILTIFALSGLFRCISRSESPINEKLIKILKFIAFFLIAAFVVGLISQLLAPNITSSTQVGELNITYYSNVPNGSMQFKFEYLFSALFCYCLSYVFKYTLYLQQSTDDTI